MKVQVQDLQMASRSLMEAANATMELRELWLRIEGVSGTVWIVGSGAQDAGPEKPRAGDPWPGARVWALKAF